MEQSFIEGVRIDGRRCAFVGEEPLVAQCVDIALANGLDVVLVASTNPIVRDHATAAGIAVVAGVDELGDGLQAHPADVLLSIANLRLVPDDVLAAVGTAINFHDGPLPGYAGLNVTTWALLAGESEHAITWHLMTSDVDGGRVVATEQFAIDPDDTSFSLNARCYEAALASFPRVAAALAAGELPTSPQPAGESRMFMRHDRPARLLDPAVPAAQTARDVRALDLGHRLRNTIGSVRVVVGGEAYVVEAARVADDPSGAAPGTIVAVDDAGARIATGAGDLVVTGLVTTNGTPVALGDVLVAGSVLPSPSADLAAAVTEIEPALSRHEQFWLRRLVMAEPTAPPVAGTARASTTIDLPDGADDAAVLAAITAWLARVTSTETVSFALTDAASRVTIDRLTPLARPGQCVVTILDGVTFADLAATAADEVAGLARRAPLLRDAIGREPHVREQIGAPPIVVDLGTSRVAHGASADGSSPALLHLAAGDGRLTVDLACDDLDPGAAERVASQLDAVLRGGLTAPATPVGDLPLLGAADLVALDALNETGVDHDRTQTIDRLFAEQVLRTPDAPALSFGPRTLTYAELQVEVDELARRFASAGVGRGDRVGIAVPRGVEMVVGVLATLQLGAAYLPLDPTYPTDRLGFMVDDAGIALLLATGVTAVELARPQVPVVDPYVVATGADDVGPTRIDHDPSDLAYLIYTSGSTGLPKGVMLEHREVVNFFVAMDAVIDVDPPGTWLAVTSLSFDISVLELLWTLGRGFHVVLKADRGISAHRPDAVTAAPRPVTFSLFYFAAGEAAASDGYRLLLDSAKVADRNGFEAVWTPERHFHAFGGAYPNPSVTGAALAAITDNVGIRAGSVVLPLHSPIRVAEEWAVVDNLSRGRVSISFAAGWQPNDFVLNPGAYATAKQDLARNIDIVRELWRGDSVTLPGHDGAPVTVTTLPRPVQRELPVWLTSAGTPATFERAGMLGVNVLTHLLGQSVEQLGENVERYRAAWREAGHEGEGRVTLMLHTYLDRDAATAREVAREPMKGYLGTAVGLLRDVASAFPTFANRGKGTDDLFKSLTTDELDQLLEVAAQRYLSGSGLFGTAADAAEMVEAVSVVGVDEVACLIDFGVETDDAMRSLDLLLDAKALVDARRTDEALAAAASASIVPTVDPKDDTVAVLVATHDVTHLQCTPSLAAMLVADPADHEALRSVQHLMLGGEALPLALAQELRGLLPGRFTNMYGPTETTIWSLTHELGHDLGPTIPIGTAIANTTIFVLDPAGHRLPVGAFGELHIGGESVARGYHNRPELTAERFVDRPGMGRVYATGDVVRVHPAGYVEFAGRSDNQVKIRGHRIELGEIESVLDQHPDVVQSVVVAREDRGDTKLVAFVVLRRADGVATADELRVHAADSMPEAMVPSAIVPLDAFPLTPNGKIDRKALPTDIGALGGEIAPSSAPPEDDTERLVAEIWTSELDRAVGRDDNFFDIGGHSLLAVKIFRRLADTTGAPLALTDVFRFPTVRTFAAHLGALQGNGASNGDAAAPAAPTGTDRGAMRRRALARRGGGDG